jgi:hypothetical protein
VSAEVTQKSDDVALFDLAKRKEATLTGGFGMRKTLYQPLIREKF